MTTHERRSTVLRGVGVHAATVSLPGSAAAAARLAGSEPPPHPGYASGPSPAPASLHVVEELEAQRQRSRQAGHEAGLREGLAAARQRIDTELAEQRERHEKALHEAHAALQREQAEASAAQALRFEAICSTLRQQFAEQMQALERGAVDLAFLSLQKMLGARDHRVQALRVLIERQVGEWRASGELRIHLNPADLALLGHADDLASLQGDHVHIVADDRLPLGGCTVQGARGQLDIGLSGQLARLGQTWLDLLAAERPQAALPPPPDHETGRADHRQVPTP